MLFAVNVTNLFKSYLWKVTWKHFTQRNSLNIIVKFVHCKPYNPAFGYGDLCTEGKYRIMFEAGGALLNQRSEFFVTNSLNYFTFKFTTVSMRMSKNFTSSPPKKWKFHLIITSNIDYLNQLTHNHGTEQTSISTQILIYNTETKMSAENQMVSNQMMITKKWNTYEIINRCRHQQ